MPTEFVSALVSRVRSLLVSELRRDLTHLRLAVGHQESRAVRAATYGDIRRSEFKVFSQWGEDGIIQYLLGKVPIANSTFIEFGVESYEESNTRFLLQNDNWRGLVIDGGVAHRRFVAREGLDWRYDLTVLSAFITRENVDELIRGAGISGDIGLLSVDIDGNDYWVLEAIESVRPRILVVEYNSVFGPHHAVTIPYDPAFKRGTAHHSNLYYGASLQALCLLAARKGFAFIGSNSAGNNAFFVRADLAEGLPRPSPEHGWVESRFRESRGNGAELTLVSRHVDRLKLIAACPLVSVVDGLRTTVGTLFDCEGSACISEQRSPPATPARTPPKR